MIKKSISLLLALIVCFSCFGTIGVSAETIFAEKAVSNNDFAIKAAEMVKKDEESMLRIIGKLRTQASEFAFPYASDAVLSESGMFVLRFENESDLLACLEELCSDPNVLFAERDIPVYTESFEKADEYLCWGPKAIEADIYADAIEPLGTVTVAVIDSGVENIDFLKDKLVDGYDFYDNDSDAAHDESDDSHGTFLASIVADCTGNLPVKIMPIRVLESKTGSLINAINGIIYAADNGADVINISMCAPLINCKALEAAVAYADSKNVPVVTAAGNAKSDTQIFCPSHCETAITVSAIDSQYDFCSAFSNFGNEVYLAAPGGGIVGYNAAGELTSLSGTSMSTAYVSAAAAMFLVDNPYCNTNQVRAALKACALDLGSTGKDDYYGWGIPKLGKLAQTDTTYVEDIRFTENALTLKIGKTVTVDPIIYPADATDKSYVITSDSNCISISGNAITAVSEGKAVITVTSTDGLYTDTAEITVILIPELKIKNNPGVKTINYGETLRLTAEVKNAPADAKIFWYVDNVKRAEGETFELSTESGAVVTVKLAFADGNFITDKNGEEISDQQTVNVKSGFFQKLISFFKKLFGISRTVIQSIKYM